MALRRGDNDVENQPLIDNRHTGVDLDNRHTGADLDNRHTGADLEDEDVIPEVIVANGSNEISLIEGKDRTLPDGKRFHLFFSHSSEDAEFVWERIKSLESPPHNLRCCFSDRDFIPGMSIQENINICMSQSMKIVLILSPSFMESGWCDYEQRIAHALSVTERTGVIPILHKPCNIPDSLKTLNYIDEKRGKDVDTKIQEALLTKAGPSNILPNGFLNWYGHGKDVSGSKVVFEAKQIPYTYSWSFPPASQEDVNQLRDLGVDISEANIQTVINLVNSFSPMRYYGFLPWSWIGFPRNCVLGCLLFCFMEFVTLLIVVSARSYVASLYAFPLVLSPAIILCIILTCCCSKKPFIRSAEVRVNEALTKFNLEWYRGAKAMVSFRADPIPKIVILFYNNDECEKFIRELLRTKARETHIEEELERDYTAESGIIMDSLVKRVAPTFARWESVKEAPFIRHPTLQNKMCLCQMYEHEPI